MEHRVYGALSAKLYTVIRRRSFREEKLINADILPFHTFKFDMDENTPSPV